jgi:hypothetical protein
LKQQGVDFAVHEPRIHEEQHERKDCDARPGERIEARPAHKRAFADQLAVFTGKPANG